MNSYKLRLDEQHLRDLVRGRAVQATIHGVPVEVTADWRWNRIAAAVLDMLAETNPLLGRPLDPAEAREFLPRRKQ